MQRRYDIYGLLDFQRKHVVVLRTLPSKNFRYSRALLHVLNIGINQRIDFLFIITWAYHWEFTISPYNTALNFTEITNRFLARVESMTSNEKRILGCFIGKTIKALLFYELYLIGSESVL